MDIIEVLNKLDTMLDCSYPPEALAKRIGFNKVYHSGVIPYIGIRNGKEVLYFEMYTPYEPSDLESLSLEELKELNIKGIE